MTKGRFLLMALVCAFETYFFNQTLFEGDYLFALFWGFVLLRDIQRTYAVDRFTQAFLSATKKKD